MSKARDTGLQIGEAFKYIDFFSGKSMEALIRLPYLLFSEYVPDGNREYERGEVVRVGNCKYLLQNWGKLNPDIPLSQQSLCKLFRDSGRYEWVREEYCIKGFERYYQDSDPNRTGWYRVISERVDSGTPPPNLIGIDWEKVE